MKVINTAVIVVKVSWN